MTLVDTVAYENLETGKQYKVAGMLMDKTTGKELLIQDKQVTAETVFEAKEAKGTVDVTFIFDGTGLAGKELVVFEKLYLVSEEGKIEVTAHEDLEDQGQTVKTLEKELPPKPETPKMEYLKTEIDSGYGVVSCSGYFRSQCGRIFSLETKRNS